MFVEIYLTSMKIGIITFWDSQNNYGQILQCFALQRYLRSLGHDVYTIKYKHKKPKISHYLKHPFKLLNPHIYTNTCKILINTIRKQIINQVEYDRQFDHFRDENIIFTDQIYTEQDLKHEPPTADVYICGSDQIWANAGREKSYFLDFGDITSKRIAVATSFGRDVNSFNKSEIKQLSLLLQQFDAITVREQEGVDICKLAGYNQAQLICDPTLLLPVETYKSLIPLKAKNPPNHGTTVIYYLGNKSIINIDEIISIMQSNRYIYKYVASQGQYDKYEKAYLTINEWLANIQNAEYVITNSFHGCVFALLFNKQFAVIPLKNSGGNTRINTLLGSLELRHRICQNVDDIERLRHEPINYNLTNTLFCNMRAQSISILSNIFNHIIN